MMDRQTAIMSQDMMDRQTGRKRNMSQEDGNENEAAKISEFNRIRKLANERMNQENQS